MSEYIEVTPLESDDPYSVQLHTNVQLTAGAAEEYASPAALAVGSPVAQALAVIPGIDHLRLDGSTLTIRRSADSEWYAIIEDVRSALIDFFL